MRFVSVELHEHVSDGGGRFGEHAVMNGEEGEFETVGDAGFVVDAAQVIFDDLFGGAEAHRDFLVFAALNDEGDDFHFLGGEAVADASSDAVLFDGEVFGSAGTDGTFAAGDASDAIDECGASYGAMHDAVDAGVEVGLDGLADFSDEEAAAAVDAGFFDDLWYGQLESRGKDDGGTAKGFHGRKEAVWFGALGDDAEVIFHGEDFGGSSAKNGLIIGQYDLIHLWVLSRYVYTRQKLIQVSSRLGSVEMPLGGHCILLRHLWCFIFFGVTVPLRSNV